MYVHVQGNLVTNSVMYSQMASRGEVEQVRRHGDDEIKQELGRALAWHGMTWTQLIKPEKER